ncbi:MAG: hypothetical protein AMS26_24250, partial [Bacteroides sp. SM23_62]
MRIAKALILIVLSLFHTTGNAQDVRTLETKIADLLAQMPVENNLYRDRLAEETYLLSSEVLKEICSRVVPPGTADDTKARFAVESLSKYLSREKPSDRTREWEEICISFVDSSNDPFVRAFFIRQLQWIGGDATIEALASYMDDDFLSSPVIAAMMQSHPDKAGKTFLEKLGTLDDISRVQAVYAIGDLRVEGASPVLIEMLAETRNAEMVRSILWSLARIGSPESYKTLADKARSSKYSPEPTGATASYLEFARTLGENGNTELSNRICRQLMKKCKSASQSHYKSSALIIYADNTSIPGALPLLTGAMKDPDKNYRMSALNYAIESGSPAAPWIVELTSARDEEIQAELIFLLGALKDKSTVSALIPFLDSPDPRV